MLVGFPSHAPNFGCCRPQIWLRFLYPAAVEAGAMSQLFMITQRWTGHHAPVIENWGLNAPAGVAMNQTAKESFPE
jgi:hypothetical protein